MQFLLSSFLEDKSEIFVEELWKLLVFFNEKNKGVREIKKAREMEIETDLAFVRKEIGEIDQVLAVIQRYEEVQMKDCFVLGKENRGVVVESSSFDSSSSLSSK